MMARARLDYDAELEKLAAAEKAAREKLLSRAKGLPANELAAARWAFDAEVIKIRKRRRQVERYRELARRRDAAKAAS